MKIDWNITNNQIEISMGISNDEGGGGGGSTVDTIKAGSATFVNGVNKAISFSSPFASTAFIFSIDGLGYSEVSRTSGQIVINPLDSGVYDWSAILKQS